MILFFSITLVMLDTQRWLGRAHSTSIIDLPSAIVTTLSYDK